MCAHVHGGLLKTIMEVVRNEVDTEVFRQIKNVIVELGRKKKGTRTIRRALIKKFPNIPKEQWANTFPILFCKTGSKVA